MSAEQLLTEVRKRLAGYFNGYMPGVYHLSADVIKLNNHVLDAIEREIEIVANADAEVAGADYWFEVAAHLADEPWFKEDLARAGLEYLYTGPRTPFSHYWKVRDAGAPAELMHRTARLTVDMVVVDPNASPPTYKYEIVERKDMNA